MDKNGVPNPDISDSVYTNIVSQHSADRMYIHNIYDFKLPDSWGNTAL